MTRKCLQPKDIETLLIKYAISESSNSDSDEAEDIPIAKRRKQIRDDDTKDDLAGSSTDTLAFESSSDENLPPGEDAEAEEEPIVIHSEEEREDVTDISDDTNPVNPIHWSTNVSPIAKSKFSGISGLQKRIDGPVDKITPKMIFDQLIDESVIELMVVETNRYAQQYIAAHTMHRTPRMKKWQDMTKNEMQVFIGVIFMTGIMKFPKMEDYWKLDKMFFHPIFHHIGMTYNRFSLILKNWHFSDNETAPACDRLHKISKLVGMVFTNIQDLYIPGEEISVDEIMISHRWRLLFKQYNPEKRPKCGIRMFKLCDTTGYVWNTALYCGKVSGNKRPGLDYSGSVVVDLAERLLNAGRFLVADNWYSSIELAKYLQYHNTAYCGTLRKNRKGIPAEITKAKLKSGEISAVVNAEGTRIIKYKDKQDVFMVSTFHGANYIETAKKYKSGENVSKPCVIVDYNRVKSGINLYEQMLEYYSPARKNIKWYRKVAFQLLSIALLNSWIIYNNYYNKGKKISLAEYTQSVALACFGEIADKTDKVKNKDHELVIMPRKEDGKILRKRCTGCYKELSKTLPRNEVQNKVKRVTTECMKCEKAFCLNCFNAAHKV